MEHLNNMHEDMQPFIKSAQMLQSLTKIDIRLNDANGQTILQWVNHSIPTVLNEMEQTIAHIHEVLEGNKPRDYYHYIDSYGLEFICAGIWIERSLHGSIVIGPILSSLSSADFKQIMFRNELPIGTHKPLEHFYQSLPILNDQEFHYIGELLIHLCIYRPIQVRRIVSKSPKQVKHASPQHTLLQEEYRLIEERYEHQQQLMNAIAKGNYQKAKNQIDHLMGDLTLFSNRVPESPVRSSKNIGFVLNTMCRLAAEKGGVHPVYLHNISEQFANLIERTATIPKLKQLFVTMVEEYCDLINTVSTEEYSPIVKRTVNYILLHLGSPLTLQQIAEEMHINPSHLSRKFKTETGMTLTEFINHKRIEEAKYHLQRGIYSITEIAFMVGFNDLNYFSKVFKKLTSQTPSQYVKNEKYEN